MGLLKSIGIRTIESIFVFFLVTLLPGLPPAMEFSPFSVTPSMPLKGSLKLNNKLNNAEHLLEGQLKGPENIVLYNGELYTSIHGGEIIKIIGDDKFVPIVKFGQPCAGIWEESICGRPLGFEFDKNGIMYVADAYYGIMKYDMKTGVKTTLVSINDTIDGKAPKIPNGLTLGSDGVIYWTDSSTDMTLEDGIYTCLGDASGRHGHHLNGYYPPRNIFQQQNKISLVSNSKPLRNTTSNSKTFGSLTLKLAVGITSITGVKLFVSKSVLCMGVQPAQSSINVNVKEPEFDWKKFLALLWPHMWHLAAAVVGALVVALINIKIPLILGEVINAISNLVKSGDNFHLPAEMSLPIKHLVIMYIAQAAFTFVYISLLSCIGERIAASMKQELFSSIMRQDISFFDSNKTGDIMNRLTVDVQEFKSSFKLCISHGLRSITQIAGCVVSLFVISPEMTGGMLLVLPSVIIVGTLLGSFLRHLSREAHAQVSKATAVGEEAISNIRTVRSFAAEETECERFLRETNEAARYNEILGIGIGMFQGGTNLFLNGLVLGTLYGGSHLMASNMITGGDLMAFLVATQTIQRSLAQLSLLFGHVIRGLSAGARVFEYINMQPTIPISGGKKIFYHSLIADVKFKNVYFSYPTRPEQQILKNFNMDLPSGSTVAVVGTSGNGKSTIAMLLERFYDVDSGSISIDGIDIRELDPAWLRGRAIGFINQEPVLFATTIMDNIRYGYPQATDEEVIAVAKLANAHDFISKFPEGYDTVLGERGVTVSGGQKQRIAIARALLKNPSILVLDEATSALDTESERIVQNAIEKLTKNRTTLVIAHRLSTVQNADIIVVLNNGVIVEIGSHTVLMNKKGFYWNLMQQQLLNENVPRKFG